MADFWAFGTRLELGDGASAEQFTEIARVTDLNGPGITQSFEDVTAHDSPSRFREFMATLLELREFSCDIIWNPANPTHDGTSGLLREILDGRLSNYQVVFPTDPAVTWSFAAFVGEFSPAAPVDGALKATITFRPSGEPTLA